MKLKITYLLFVLTLVTAIFLSIASSGGRAAAQNAGNTGAPGDANVTCGGCHATSSSIQIAIDISLEDQDGVAATDEYIPGATYNLGVKIDDVLGTPAVYGFQLLALKAALDEAGDEASDYTDISANAQKSFASSTNRSYLEQASPSTSNEFSAKWTAPEVGSGPISFYFCGNGANGNGGTTGDNIACGKIQFNEGSLSSINMVSGLSEVQVFPNPTNGQMTLELMAEHSQAAQLSIVNLAGQKLEHRPVEINTGANILNIDLANFYNGIYLLQLRTAEGMITRKIAKY